MAHRLGIREGGEQVLDIVIGERAQRQAVGGEGRQGGECGQLDEHSRDGMATAEVLSRIPGRDSGFIAFHAKRIPRRARAVTYPQINRRDLLCR